MSRERGIISTYRSGVDLVVEWKIENFFSLLEPDGKWYCCPKFSFEGKEWFLSIRLTSSYFYFGGVAWDFSLFPNSSSGGDSSGHADLRLVKCGSDRSIKQSFSLSLKTARGEKYNEQNCTKDFGRNYPGNCHTLLQFTPRLELSRRRSELVPEGVLTVVCTMKRFTYTGSASNVASVECCHCKGTFNADSLSSHQKKCMHRAVKCPDCLQVVVLQKWFDEHKCQQERPEGRKYPQHPCVEVSTQTVEASIQTFETSTQTVGEKCEACTSGSSTNSQEKKALHDFKELFLNKEECDITIKVKGSEFPAHRVILKARSPVLSSTF